MNRLTTSFVAGVSYPALAFLLLALESTPAVAQAQRAAKPERDAQTTRNAPTEPTATQPFDLNADELTDDAERAGRGDRGYDFRDGRRGERGPGMRRRFRERPLPPVFDDEQRERIRTFVRENFPEHAERLERLRLSNESMADQLERRHWPSIVRIIELKRRDPELGQLAADDFRLESDIRDVVHDLRTATDSDARTASEKKLRELIAQQVGVRLDMRERRIASLETELARQRAKLSADRGNQQQLVERRKDEMLNLMDLGEWSAAPEQTPDSEPGGTDGKVGE